MIIHSPVSTSVSMLALMDKIDIVQYFEEL